MYYLQSTKRTQDTKTSVGRGGVSSSRDLIETKTLLHWFCNSHLRKRTRQNRMREIETDDTDLCVLTQREPETVRSEPLGGW